MKTSRLFLFAVLLGMARAPADAAGSEAEVTCTTNTQDREVLQKDSDQRERTDTSPDRPSVKACRDGYCYETHVAERIFHSMLAGQQQRIQLRLEYELKDVVVEDGRVVAVNLADRTWPERLVRCYAKVFIDASDEGDLAASTGASFRTGRESRSECGEPHAGRVYLRFGTTDLLSGSTGQADDATEAYCFRFHASNVAANRVPIQKPAQPRRLAARASGTRSGNRSRPVGGHFERLPPGVRPASQATAGNRRARRRGVSQRRVGQG